MTEAGWKFADGDEDVIGSSSNAVRCPKHPFPLDIPPPPSLTKGTLCITYLKIITIHSICFISNA